MNLKKIGNVFTSKSVGTGPSSCEKRIYRAAVFTKVEKQITPESQRKRVKILLEKVRYFCPTVTTIGTRRQTAV